jgi:uncharacterized membrane protein
MTKWEIVRWLHLLAMAFFIGGQMVLAGAVVPAFRGSEERDRLRAIARRFGAGSLIALVVLLVTGALMANRFHLWDDGQFQLKLGLVVATGGLVVWHMRRPNQHWQEGLIFLFSLAIVWIGVALSH